MEKTIDEFSGQKNGYSVSKTLRFELKPIGKTLENISKGKFLESDKKKSEDYKDAKKIIDNYHQYFIDEVLKTANLDWQKLADEIKEYSKTKDDDAKLILEQEKQREQIFNLFAKDEKYNI